MSERGFRSVSHFLDTLVNMLKWPTAVAALLLLPSCVVAVARLTWSIVAQPAPMLWFSVGAGAYWLGWRLILRRPLLGSFLLRQAPRLRCSSTSVLTGGCFWRCI
jgi:hypothetical protein